MKDNPKPRGTKFKENKMVTYRSTKFMTIIMGLFCN